MMASILDKYDENVKQSMILAQNVSGASMTTTMPTVVVMSTSAGVGYSSGDNLTTASAVQPPDVSQVMSAEAVARRIEVAGAVTLAAGIITVRITH